MIPLYGTVDPWFLLGLFIFACVPAILVTGWAIRCSSINDKKREEERQRKEEERKHDQNDGDETSQMGRERRPPLCPSCKQPMQWASSTAWWCFDRPCRQKEISA